MSDTSPLADRYRAAVEVGDLAALTALYHHDALLDAHVPNWRFQVQGRDAIVGHTGGLPGPGRFSSFDAQLTARGDLLVQLEWCQAAGAGGQVSHELHLLRITEGRIAEQLLFCAGIWSAQLQAQMAAEAPLVRP